MIDLTTKYYKPKERYRCDYCKSIGTFLELKFVKLIVSKKESYTLCNNCITSLFNKYKDESKIVEKIKESL